LFTIQDIKEALPFLKWMKETSLGGNQWKDDMRTRFSWNVVVEDENKKEEMVENLNEFDNIIIEDKDVNDIILRPMEIRSFILGF
jgi:hypothetical protein